MRIHLTSRRRWYAAAFFAVLLAGAAAGGGLVASDHKDGPITTENPAIDIADVYAFRSPADAGRVVLVMNVHGFIPPAEAGSVASDPTLLYEFKIDTNGDAVADQVVQAHATGTGADQRIHFRGPAAPTMAGASSRLLAGGEVVSVPFTSPGDAQTASGGGMTVFAGVRDDPFFFDFARYQQIVAGSADSFRQPGIDTFAETNVLARWAAAGRPPFSCGRRSGAPTCWTRTHGWSWKPDRSAGRSVRPNNGARHLRGGGLLSLRFWRTADAVR